MSTRFILHCLIFITSIGSLPAQIVGLDLLGGRDYVHLPFKLEQGFIIVDVRLENIVPLKMIFDTGAENTILFDKEIAQILGI